MTRSARKISVSAPELRRSRDIRPEALVAFVKDASEWDASVASTVALRDHVAPLADWIEIDTGRGSLVQREHRLRSELANALRHREMRSNQLVILSWHNSANFALDLILLGKLSCAGIVAVDVPWTLPHGPVSATAASFRIALHDGQSDQACTALIDALRRQDADIRLMTLPSGGPEARDITTRAIATFLSELTAKACRPTEIGGFSYV